MHQAWLGAGVAFALGIAIAVLALPPAAEEEVVPATLDETAEIAIARVRETGVAERPTWNVGDAWRVQFDEGDPICWLVIAPSEEGYHQGIWCPTDETEMIAVNLAVAQVPFLTLFTNDLEGVADGEGDPTRWFDWPLTDGKAWETNYLGADVDVSAARSERGFEMTMTFADSDVELARYDYDPGLRWWSELAFEQGYTFRVHERAAGWSEPVTLATAERQFDGTSNLVSQFTSAFTTEEKDDYVVLTASRPSLAGEYWEIAGPGETRNSLTPLGTRPLVGGFDSYELIPADPGDWTYRQAGTGVGGFRVRIFVADVEIVSL